MTFFDEFKRSASDVAGKAAKKTNELTSIAKLNMSIKSCESKLVAVYEEIGRMFYTAERSGEDYTSEIAVNIMKADKIKTEISMYKAKLAKLRKIVICEGCGNEISDESAYCSFCGFKIVKTAEESVEETAQETELPDEMFTEEVTADSISEEE